MALPKQVQQRMDEVEAIEKQLKGDTAAPDESTETTSVEKVVEAPVEQEAQPILEETTVSEVVELEEAPKVPDEDAAVWKQKYKTLQGMYDKEVPNLHSKVKEMSSQLQELQTSMEAKEAVVKQAEKLVTDDDVKNFGEDLIEVQRKVAREVAAEFQTDLDAMKLENDALRKQLGTTDNKVAESSFQNRLHRLVPDFDRLNDDPKWVAWLDEVDPVLRGPRRKVAQEAFATGDADGVAHYVDLYRSGQVEPTPAEEPKQTQELERQIQPSRTAASATTTSNKGKNYTNSDVSKMFKKAATLNSAGKYDEANKLEAEIDAAYMEGRVSA